MGFENKNIREIVRVVGSWGRGVRVWFGVLRHCADVVRARVRARTWLGVG